MKVVTITQANQKGQVVIPKKIRETLDIDVDTPLNLVLRGGGVYIYPVEEIITKTESENSFVNLLQKTKGKWANDEWNKTKRKRKSIELKASRTRKQLW